MNNKCIFKKKCLPALSLLPLVLSCAFAHASNSSDLAEEAIKKVEQVEIITVTGSRPLGFFREQLRESEQAFYDQLNNAIQQDEFKIECMIETRSFSRVATRVCQPKYVDLIKGELSQDALQQGSGRNEFVSLSSRRLLERKMEKKRTEHLEKMKAVIEADPTLQISLLNLNKAKHSLEKKKKEEFGARWVSQEATEYMEQTKEFVEPK